MEDDLDLSGEIERKRVNSTSQQFEHKSAYARNLLKSKFSLIGESEEQ